jgi:hypothetical protein
VKPRSGGFAERGWGISGRAMTAAQRNDELFTIWSAARAEANLAYEAWCDLPGADSYSVYRAAEDRADAAEQSLAMVGAELLAV